MPSLALCSGLTAVSDLYQLLRVGGFFSGGGLLSRHYGNKPLGQSCSSLAVMRKRWSTADKLWIQRTPTQTLSEQRGGNKASLSHPSTPCPSIIPLCVATTCQCQSVFSSCQPPAMNQTGQWEASLLISWRDLIM